MPLTAQGVSLDSVPATQRDAATQFIEMDMGLFFDPLLQLIDRLGESGSYSGISSR